MKKEMEEIEIIEVGKNPKEVYFYPKTETIK